MEKAVVSKQDTIKSKAFQLLCVVDDICSRNNIRYFIYAGTLLGAIRHKGFIPWDDDIDVVMFRSEYNRFIEACKTDLNTQKYFLQTIFSDPLTSNPWAKLHDINTAFISGVRRSGAAEGINIDIFPVDNAPDSKIIRNIRAKLIDKLNYIYQYRFQAHMAKSSRKMRLFQWAISLIPPWNEQKYKIRYDGYVQKYNKQETCNVVYLSNRKYKKKVVPREWLSDSVRVSFEDRLFPAPKEWEKVLISLYGKNYMQLPPQEDRVTVHGTKIIDVNRSWRSYKDEQQYS